MELGLAIKPEAIEDVWNVIVQRHDQLSYSLPSDTRISSVFDEFSKALLILGAPGCGKTTLLLELAKDLLDKAERDPNQPIPAVFNLSSWASKQHPLFEWLVEELIERYQVPRKYAQIWIDKGLIIPLLDGLDEVASEHRSPCAESINVFRKEHGLVPMAVCCRVSDYEALTIKLRLNGALVVQPLSYKQTIHFLNQAGESLTGVKAALKADETLFELLDTPLMLSIAALAYCDSSKEVVLTGNFQERKSQLFSTYTDAMFNRRGKTLLYSRQKTVIWMAWLASTMIYHNQSVFYIEWIQPSWLFSKWQQKLVHVGAAILSALSGMVIGGLLGGVSYLWNKFFPQHDPFAWMSNPLLHEFPNGPVDPVGLYKENLIDQGLECPSCWLDIMVSSALEGGIIGLWLGCLIGSFILLLKRNWNIKSIETVWWKWVFRSKQSSLSLKNGFICGLVIGGLLGILNALLETIGVDGTLVMYINLSIPIGLIIGFFGGFLT